MAEPEGAQELKHNKHSVPPPHARPTGTDDLAHGEEKAYSENVDQSKKTSAHRRAESLRDIYSHGLNWVVRVIVFVLVVAILIVAWHRLLPESWRWLDAGDLSEIMTFLFSGAVISAVSLHVQKNL